MANGKVGRPKGLPKTGGRSKGTPNEAIKTIKELARQYAPEAFDTLLNIMRTSESDQSRVAAVKEILDRGYGKPAQAMDITVTASIADQIEQVRSAFDRIRVERSENRPH